MALSRDQKAEAVKELTDLLSSSKVTVFANYSGLSVKDMQELRKQARENGTRVLVAKNRLFKIAASKVDGLKDADLSNVTGQLAFAFNAEDEVAPAQSLHAFAKEHPQLEFVGAVDQEGTVMTTDEVKHLATLPSKDQLRGQLVGTIAAPLTGFVGVMSGNLRGVVNVLHARKEQLEG